MPMPTLTSQARPGTFQVEALNERGETVPTAIAGEHALTLYLDFINMFQFLLSFLGNRE